jgi:hypothetical protein
MGTLVSSSNVTQMPTGASGILLMIMLDYLPTKSLSSSLRRRLRE